MFAVLSGSLSSHTLFLVFSLCFSAVYPTLLFWVPIWAVLPSPLMNPSTFFIHFQISASSLLHHLLFPNLLFSLLHRHLWSPAPDSLITADLALPINLFLPLFWDWFLLLPGPTCNFSLSTSYTFSSQEPALTPYFSSLQLLVITAVAVIPQDFKNLLCMGDSQIFSSDPL